MNSPVGGIVRSNQQLQDLVDDLPDENSTPALVKPTLKPKVNPTPTPAPISPEYSAPVAQCPPALVSIPALLEEESVLVQLIFPKIGVIPVNVTSFTANKNFIMLLLHSRQSDVTLQDKATFSIQLPGENKPREKVVYVEGGALELAYRGESIRVLCFIQLSGKMAK
jgi:hypothetical protein